MEPFDLREGMSSVITVGLRGLKISAVSLTHRKDTGCDLLNVGHPLVLSRQHGGHLALAMQPSVEVSIRFLQP